MQTHASFFLFRVFFSHMQTFRCILKSQCFGPQCGLMRVFTTIAVQLIQTYFHVMMMYLRLNNWKSRTLPVETNNWKSRISTFNAVYWNNEMNLLVHVKLKLSEVHRRV